MKDVRGSPRLTAKQEKFVLALVEGKSQREAYKEAYDTSRMKDETIDNKAYQLFKKGEIRARYDELMLEIKERSLWNFERAQEELIEMLEDSKESRNFAGRYNAIKELNTLLNLYEKNKEESKTDKVISVLDKLEDLL